MFTDDMWELMVTETNRYHDQQVAAEPNKHKRKWVPVTREELEAFIGTLIYIYGNCEAPTDAYVLEP